MAGHPGVMVKVFVSWRAGGDGLDLLDETWLGRASGRTALLLPASAHMGVEQAGDCVAPEPPDGNLKPMNGVFDLTTLLFLILAVAVIVRLISVLGRKTGNERRLDTYATRDAGKVAGAPAGNDNVVTLPRSDTSSREAGAAAGAEDAAARIRAFVPGDSPLLPGLLEIARSDPSFDPKHFMKGAKTAYEMIVMAFAEGNRRMLKNLVSRDVFDGFVRAITDRESRGEVSESSFVGINRADVIDAEVRNATARITVKFASQLITAVRSKSGEIIEGDPKQIRDVTDIWTFARELASKDPNWKLVATQSAN